MTERVINTEGEVTGAKEEPSDYSRGFWDALEDKGCRPNSLDYVRGYKKGLETKQIGSQPSH